MTAAKRKRVGRPPTGNDGERLQDYQRLTLRLPAATMFRLKAWASVRSVPAWRLIDEAINGAIDRLEGEDAQLVKKLARRNAERTQGEE